MVNTIVFHGRFKRVDNSIMILTIISGNPVARPPSNLTVRSEDDAYLQCPVAGYPITRTVWQKNMVSVPNDSRHTLFDNGTLFIRSTKDTVDSGLYVCTKINEVGQSATGNLYLRIMSKCTPTVTTVKYEFPKL